MTEGAFSAKLHDESNLDVLGDDKGGRVKEYMQPAPALLWLRSEDEEEKRA